MATNSKREQILVAVVNNIEDIPAISVVKRMRPAFADLENVAHTEIPLVAVVGKLPAPVQKRSGRQTGIIDKFLSDLEVELYCYALENVEPDTKVSDLSDDLWSKLYSDPTLITDAYPKGLALWLNIRPEVQVGFWDPYIVFKMICTYQYVHDTGGI